LFCESNKNDPDTCGDDPESTTSIPPNLKGAVVLSFIRLVLTLNCDDVMYCIDDVTAVKLVTFNVPLMVRSCVSVGPIYDAVAAKDAVAAIEAVAANDDD
jgi:hypothetical protein